MYSGVRKVSALPKMDNGHHGEDGGSLLGRIDHFQGQELGFCRFLAALGPGQEELHTNDAQDDENGRGGKAQGAQPEQPLWQKTTPQLLRLLNPNADQNNRSGGEENPNPVDGDPWNFMDWPQAKTEKQHHRRKGNDDAEGVAPANPGAQGSGQEEGGDGGDGLHRA